MAVALAARVAKVAAREGPRWLAAAAPAGAATHSPRRFLSSPPAADHFPLDFPQSQFKRVEAGHLREFCCQALTASGAQRHHAEAVARVLVEADLRAVYSHGINRLKMYVDECKTGTVAVGAEPRVERERGATAVVDGSNCLGAVVGEYAMRVAIDKAKEHGLGWVLARNSNHYGIAGHYAMMALEEDLIGMSWTNTSPIGKLYFPPTHTHFSLLHPPFLPRSQPQKRADVIRIFIRSVQSLVVKSGADAGEEPRAGDQPDRAGGPDGRAGAVRAGHGDERGGAGQG